MEKREIYFIIFKVRGDVLLLMRDMQAFMDEHESCTLSIVEQIYAAFSTSKKGVEELQSGNFELKIVKRSMIYNDDIVSEESIKEWFKEIRNHEAVPAEVRGLVSDEVGCLTRLCPTAVGLLQGIPVREEMVLLDYVAEEATESLKNTIIGTRCN